MDSPYGGRGGSAPTVLLTLKQVVDYSTSRDVAFLNPLMIALTS